MKRFVVRSGRLIYRRLGRAVAFGRERSLAFGELWRRSLQVRVVVSTLALSSAVVFVLGMVLQNQITERLLTSKQDAATLETQVAVAIADRELRGGRVRTGDRLRRP
jgi:two-component system sensor histidine kinase MtrB